MSICPFAQTEIIKDRENGVPQVSFRGVHLTDEKLKSRKKHVYLSICPD